jgi:uncharacterized protein (UPF0248 family)
MEHSKPEEVSHIQKEDLTQLSFPSHEVLKKKEAIEKRRKDLEQAVILGNTYKEKTKIVFEDGAGIKQIETHIWGLTDKRVILKQGMVIPIHRIHEVKL